MISAIKKFKEENEIPVEDEQILSADDSSILDLSNSKLICISRSIYMTSVLNRL